MQACDDHYLRPARICADLSKFYENSIGPLQLLKDLNMEIVTELKPPRTSKLANETTW